MDQKRNFYRAKHFVNDGEMSVEFTSHSFHHKPVTNVSQTDHKRVTTHFIQEKNGSQTGHKTGHKEVSLSYWIETIKNLNGLQKNIFDYVVELCSLNDYLTTSQIRSRVLATAVNCRVTSIKTSLNRLIEKKLLLRLPGKSHRGGYRVLGITKEIKTAHSQVQADLYQQLKRSETGHKTSHNSLYNSSSNKKTTTTSLTQEWEKIDFSSIQQIGFSKYTLRQIAECGMANPEVVQDSIHHLAFGLEHNPNLKNSQSILNKFVGVLRKGNKWIERDFLLMKNKEVEQSHKDEIKKVNENQEKIEKELEAKKQVLIDKHFENWRKTLVEQEVVKITGRFIKREGTVTSCLRGHFKGEVLPQIMKEMEGK